MLAFWRELWRDEEGQGMAEYGLILALIAIVVIGALTVLGKALYDKFNEVGKTVQGTQ
ncbi:Flp family type IVb pilin [Ammonifex thiophilus]|uniref:Flp family type IVb pilin n=1 Tax=Ammonifex thiophilus TaxID=444093 RepID=A0A3D8P6E6_9THEO|nr:Flp family type IVb pilin [Ammonifex thiophilus]RDV84067.1 Flp family type IVb pilin [Ammonifex thiophilus]